MTPNAESDAGAPVTLSADVSQAVEALQRAKDATDALGSGTSGPRSPFGPQGMYDLSGWEPIGCVESDHLRGSKRLTVASSLTDPHGNYSSGVTFTEWWADNKPLLRDYLYSDAKSCEHFLWTSVTSPVRGQS